MHPVQKPTDAVGHDLDTLSLHCPACGTHVQCREAKPRSGVTYRCPVCSADIIEDMKTGTLILAPTADLT